LPSLIQQNPLKFPFLGFKVLGAAKEKAKCSFGLYEALKLSLLFFQRNFHLKLHTKRNSSD
jgi:hypothetical protein